MSGLWTLSVLSHYLWWFLRTEDLIVSWRVQSVTLQLVLFELIFPLGCLPGLPVSSSPFLWKAFLVTNIAATPQTHWQRKLKVILPMPAVILVASPESHTLPSNWRDHPSRQARFAIRRQGPPSTPLVLFMPLTGGGGELSGSEGGTCVSLSSGLCIHNMKRITIRWVTHLFIYLVISS